MTQELSTFLFRWLLNSFGLWVAVRLFGGGYASSNLSAGLAVFLLAGLIFSIVNRILRPIVIILSLPAIILTLGLFTLVVNGLMVYITLKLTPGLTMGFWSAILSGVVLSLVNYIINSMVLIARED